MINKIALAREGWYGTGNQTKIGISGVITGVKYYLKSDPRKRIYNYFDNMILSYHTHDMLERPHSPDEGIQTVTSSYYNHVFYLQLMAGSGFEFRFFRYFRYSFDFGIGYSYRKYVYEKSYLDNPDHIGVFTLQLKTGLGFVF